MKIRLITIAHKAPEWLQAGYEDYRKRLPKTYAFQLHELPLEKRQNQNNVTEAIEKEAEKLLGLCKPGDYVVALDQTGKAWTTSELALQLSNWQQSGQDINLLIGGPDGLSKRCLKRANACWSLSNLTFPHLLVRLIVVEQIYRAFTILNNHPYHRA